MSIRMLFIMLLLSCCTLTGCMSAQYSRDRRIAENLELFNSFSPEVQEKLSQGQIDIGYSEDMVRIAWGAPDHVYLRTTEKGEATVWTYSGTRILSRTDRISVPVPVYDDRGRSRVVYRSAWVDRDLHEEYDQARVEFVQGIVTAIEQLSP